MSSRVGCFALLVVGLLVLGIIGALPPQIIFLAHLAFGWIGYLGKVLPQARMNGMGVATAALCLAGVLLLGHMLARWLMREINGRAWSMRWTLSITAIIVFMFVAGIGAVGFAHQSVWLARSDRPIFTYSRRPLAQRVRCASNLRQIGQALTLYANDHGGRLPDTLGQLFLHLKGDLTAEVLVCPAGNAEKAPGATEHEQAAHLHDFRYCSYVYHGRGLTMPLPADRPIMAEPLVNHDDEGMNILFGDGRVEWMTPAAALKVMEQR
jgi:prepilin-type processing-associated H-X9-DG protein